MYKFEERAGRRISINIYEDNRNTETIFMLHGLGGRGEQWREQIKYLRSKYRLVVPDLLGHGESEKPISVNKQDNPYSFTNLNADVQFIFDKYAGSKNFVFGHSYGGAFATFLAYNNKSKIEKLVLITPLPCKPVKTIPFIYWLPISILEKIRPYLDKGFEKLAFYSTEPSDLLLTERAARNKNSMYLIKSLFLGLKEIPLLNINQMLIPTLIISGKADKIIPIFQVKKFYSQLPNHEFHIIDKASHMVLLEQADSVNQLIDKFL